MPDSPEDEELRLRRERTEVIRRESAALAAELERDRVRLDRQVRIAGGVTTAITFGLMMMGPLTARGAATGGIGLVCGPLAVLLGGQGATRPENLPTWLRWTYVAGAILGGMLGGATLR